MGVSVNTRTTCLFPEEAVVDFKVCAEVIYLSLQLAASIYK